MPADGALPMMLDYQALIRDAQMAPPLSIRQRVDAVKCHASPTFVMGRNPHARALMDKLAVDGVVDDFEERATRWNGSPIIRSNAIPSGASVINCAMSISPNSARKRIETRRDLTHLSYIDLCRAEPSLLPLPDFVRDARAEFARHPEKYLDVFSRLTDAESRSVFNRVMAYRLTGDMSHMAGFSVRLRDQYFEPFLGPLRDSVFVDCGGYDGDTTEEFIRRYPGYSKVYLFEPSRANMARARSRLQAWRDTIEFVPLGLSDSPGELSFDADQGSASAVSGSGTETIQVSTLDAEITSRASFIKMDLEGWELKALHGAEKHIRNDDAILAIAVYHTTSDFWRIPAYILSINAGYDVLLRHYTEGWSETVMYFVPRGATAGQP
ncbi:FkbM family methyltransferase [Zoogloea dura]|uniref:FkbM family methyltransferase n=1 Tax=Zoogloea dura TaxID=2728840 RepID=A0A848G118_9RHOO|nr:FkbM family methyltransferase [Zoogloea dura]NML24984.1 FkbM family methyltransferase [Zoogloea dura]